MMNKRPNRIIELENSSMDQDRAIFILRILRTDGFKKLPNVIPNVHSGLGCLKLLAIYNLEV